MAKTKYEIQTEAEVPNLGTIVYVSAPFDEGLKALKRKDASQISAKNLAYARIKLGKENSVSQNGSWIKEGVLYVPNSEHRIILTKDSLVAKYPKEAVDSHRDGKEYFVSQKQADEIIEKAHCKDNSVFVLDSLKPVSTKRFKDDERTLWVFGDIAGEYGDFLRGCGINEMPFWFNENNYINNQEKPYANQLWVHRLSDGSGLNGNCGSLSCYDWVRGVLDFGEANEKNFKADKPKIEAYTPKEISKALKSLKLSGLEEQVMNALKKE